MIELATEVDESVAPPNFAFMHLLTLLGALRDYQGRYGELPERIDKAFWHPLFHDSIGFPVISGLKRLGLLRAEGNIPAPAFESVVNPKTRKPTLHKVLERTYGDILPLLGRTDTTRAEITQRIGDTFHVQGTTRRRCVGFLIPAARYAGFPVASDLLSSIEQVRQRFSGPHRGQPDLVERDDLEEEHHTESTNGSYNGHVSRPGREVPVAPTSPTSPLTQPPSIGLSEEAATLARLFGNLARRLPPNGWDDEVTQDEWLKRLAAFNLVAENMARLIEVRGANDKALS